MIHAAISSSTTHQLDVDSNEPHRTANGSVSDIGTARIVHRILVDRNQNVLGCIDQLDHNGELIRLDGGKHWATAKAAPSPIAELIPRGASWEVDGIPARV